MVHHPPSGHPFIFLKYPLGENLENQYAKNYTSFSSRFSFNGKEWEGRAFKNRPVAYFSAGARLPRWRVNYNYGARYYDPKVSVWLSVDPLSHLSPSQTPYHFVSNNPVMRIDPNGLTDYTLNKKSGKITVVKGTETTTGTDRLIAGKARYNKAGGLKNKNFHEVDKSVFGTGKGKGDLNTTPLPDKSGTGTVDVQTFSMGTGKESEELYDFIGWNTKAEVAKYDLKTGSGSAESVFFSSGQREGVDWGTNYLEGRKAADPDLLLIDATHNHGNLGGSVLGSIGPSGPDKQQVDYLLNGVGAPGGTPVFNQKTPPTFNIWRFGQKHQYNETGRIK